jgi:hypothetical protein
VRLFFRLFGTLVCLGMAIFHRSIHILMFGLKMESIPSPFRAGLRRRPPRKRTNPVFLPLTGTVGIRVVWSARSVPSDR